MGEIDLVARIAHSVYACMKSMKTSVKIILIYWEGKMPLLYGITKAA